MKQINVLNFRELGGYINVDGKKVKEHLLYRGGPLYTEQLSDEDKNYLDSIGFKYIIDFRSKNEIARGGELYLPKGAEYLNLLAITEEMDTKAFGDLDMEYRKTEPGIVEWLENVYRMMPFNNEAYQTLFELLKNHESPIYIHCSAGKDRTGMASALILLALGVDQETAIQDYLVSYNNMVEDMKKRNLIPERPNLVFREWLELAFNEILDKYPSFNDYFKAELNVEAQDLKALQEYYLD